MKSESTKQQFAADGYTPMQDVIQCPDLEGLSANVAVSKPKVPESENYSISRGTPTAASGYALSSISELSFRSTLGPFSARCL